ncbi:hypothetical protein FN846DRAFT_775762 [Sphaerosporella brunnea]|uniref:Uncharacterized protein n=1 Tax=Sphaerosporella brunnea TaxID=1250544 RepID=A0A5J5F1Q0_9PEZI|nr:hypothetical protein FN846DRAFT_775762 [Sphaerosporella brunnea]
MLVGFLGAAITSILKRYFKAANGETPGCGGKFRPQFFFCSTTHARFIPNKHSFKYPLLYVGIPLGLKGAIGTLLSVKASESEYKEAKNQGKSLREKWTFFTVDPARYLNAALPFNEKLYDVIKGHGLNPDDYPHAYLVTTPAFLGYSFNPVSYYYLYNAAQELKLVVLEVLNTFGEKHIYLLRSDDPRNLKPRKGYEFAGTMEKVFHISSFNHRSGSYVIQVRDPLRKDNKTVDVHMAVYNKEGQKAMVARAFSNASSFDALSGSILGGWLIALTWGWNTFLALPETFFEAWKLYRKGTTIHTRPEPLKGSTKRKATRAERKMQNLFLGYLESRVSAFGGGLEVKITLPESEPHKSPSEVVYLSKKHGTEETRKLHIRVLNPRFFLRFFSNQDPAQTIWMDYTAVDAEFRPVVIEAGSIKLLKTVLSLPGKKGHGTTTSWTWYMISRFRNWKTDRELRDTSAKTKLSAPKLYDSASFNALDKFFLVHNRVAYPKSYRMYQWSVVHALLADVIGFGDAGNLELYASILKAVGAVTAAIVVNVAAALHIC